MTYTLLLISVEPEVGYHRSACTFDTGEAFTAALMNLFPVNAFIDGGNLTVRSHEIPNDEQHYPYTRLDQKLMTAVITYCASQNNLSGTHYDWILFEDAWKFENNIAMPLIEKD